MKLIKSTKILCLALSLFLGSIVAADAQAYVYVGGGPGGGYWGHPYYHPYWGGYGYHRPYWGGYGYYHPYYRPYY